MLFTRRYARKYVAQVRRDIKFSSSSKKHFLRMLKKDINNYIAEHPDASYQTIETEFGTPHETAHQYLHSLDVNELQKLFRFKKRLILSMLIFSACVICSYLYYYHEVRGTVPTFTFNLTPWQELFQTVSNFFQ